MRKSEAEIESLLGASSIKLPLQTLISDLPCNFFHSFEINHATTTGREHSPLERLKDSKQNTIENDKRPIAIALILR
jgi:hypothetical protein